jgi:hypothetical protein
VYVGGDAYLAVAGHFAEDADDFEVREAERRHPG